VTKSENKQLSLLTNNKGNDYKVFVPTDKKYKHLGINLYETVKKGSRWNMKNVTPFEYQTLPVPSDLLSYEKQFLIG
jgi:hypothetical protein